MASEDVILHLLYSKCIPVLIYGLESFVLNSSDKRSVDFVLQRFLMKLFHTSVNLLFQNVCLTLIYNCLAT